MKKIILILSIFTIAIVSCKKKVTPNASDIVTVSYPTITLTGAQFYSIPVGGSVPSIAATAYDSIYNESCATELDASELDNSTPGLYIVQVKATNSKGYYSKTPVLLAVTDISSSWDLSGVYQRTATGVNINLTQVANGLYETDNYFGAATTPGAIAYFVQTDDSTIVMPTQETPYGTMSSTSHFLDVTPTDTSYGYKLFGVTSNNVLRTFVKQ